MKIRDFLLRRKKTRNGSEGSRKNTPQRCVATASKAKFSSSEQTEDKNAAKITISEHQNDFIRSYLQLPLLWS